MKKILSYLKPFAFQLTLVVGLLIIQALTTLYLPRIMAAIVDIGIYNGDIAYILQQAGLMIFVALISIASAIAVSFLATTVGSKAAANIRKEAFEQIEAFSLVEFEKFTTASLITRVTNDVQQIQQLFTFSFRMMIYAPLMAVGGFILVFSQSSQLSWIFAILIPVLVAFIVLLFTYAKPRFELLQKKVDKINQIARQLLTGIRVIRAFNSQKQQAEVFNQASLDYRKMGTTLNKVLGLVNPFFNLILNLAIIIIVWVSAQLIARGSLQVGTMISFMQYTTQIMFSFIMLSFIFVFYPRAAVSAERVAEVLTSPIAITNPEVAETFCKDCHGKVEFRNVSFRYPDAQNDVLSNISFISHPNTITAFIGSTGSGKSTLINLLPRFFDPTSGEIFIDDVNIKHVSLKELRNKIGLVPQKSNLFTGDIQFNLTLNNPQIQQETLEQSVKIAQAENVILEKEDGYQHQVTQGATNLSGGQKQRLAIARALAKKPEILLFDDSFSALDMATDAALRKQLKTLKNTNVFIVTQRISAIIDADQIVVLDDGKVVGVGTHKQLLETCQVYREIAISQAVLERAS